jgi:hypothetical protein
MPENKGDIRCIDPLILMQRIRTATDEDVEAVNERKETLRDALNSFDERLRDLPERERNAALSVFYAEITDKVFDFTTSVITNQYRGKITAVKTVEKKRELLHECKAIFEDLMMLYGI